MSILPTKKSQNTCDLCDFFFTPKNAKMILLKIYIPPFMCTAKHIARFIKVKKNKIKAPLNQPLIRKTNSNLNSKKKFFHIEVTRSRISM